MSSVARIRPDLWVSRTTSPALAALVGLGVAHSLLTGRARSSPSRLVFAAGTVVALSTIRLVVSPAGVSVGLGPWGYPCYRIPRQRIESVRASEAGVLQFFGLGLRWRPGKVGLVLRSGPALTVRTASGREIVVSTDDPAGAVSAFAAADDR